MLEKSQYLTFCKIVKALICGRTPYYIYRRKVRGIKKVGGWRPSTFMFALALMLIS